MIEIPIYPMFAIPVKTEIAWWIAYRTRVCLMEDDD